MRPFYALLLSFVLLIILSSLERLGLNLKPLIVGIGVYYFADWLIDRWEER